MPSHPKQVLIRQHTFPNGLVLVAETMPGVQSAAFTLLLPAGAAYDPADAAARRRCSPSGSRAARATATATSSLSALDNLGVNHGESAQTLHTSVAAATLGRNLIPALEIFADVVLRPRFDDDEVEPIRALALQNLRSLEDDPGTRSSTSSASAISPTPGAALRRARPKASPP